MLDKRQVPWHIVTEQDLSATLIDVCGRQIIAYNLGLTCKETDAARTLQSAVTLRQAEWAEPLVIHTTMGPNLSSRRLKNSVQHSP